MIAPAALTRRREFLGMSVDELAVAVGVSSRAVRYWEAGSRAVGDQTFGRLLHVLRCEASEITSRLRGTETLADLRRDAALSTEDVAAALRGKKIVAGIYFTAEKVRDLERGRRVRGWKWRSPAVLGLVATALGEIYGVPDRVVLDAWRRSRQDALLPAVASAPDRSVRRDAIAVWEGLNARQQHYLSCVFALDQEAEQVQRANRAPGGRRIAAAEWRLMTLSLGAPASVVGYTDLQRRLRGVGVHDPGAGSSVAALRRRGLIRVYHDRVFLDGIGEVARNRVEMTRNGRLVARAALGVERETGPAAPLLSRWLWQIVVRVAVAGARGVDGSLSGRGPHYLAVGQSPGGKVRSRGFIVLRLPDGVTHGPHRWLLTDAGRQHVIDYLDTYRELYPDVDTSELPVHNPESVK
jgi:transcriptional regulator with XRE-family HTH domain